MSSDSTTSRSAGEGDEFVVRVQLTLLRSEGFGALIDELSRAKPHRRGKVLAALARDALHGVSPLKSTVDDRSSKSQPRADEISESAVTKVSTPATRSTNWLEAAGITGDDLATFVDFSTAPNLSGGQGAGG